MKTISQGKALILRQQGKVSGLKSQTKSFNQFLNKNYKNAEKELISAKNDYLKLGHFDDCGDSYEKSLYEAEGNLDHAQKIRSLSADLIDNIKKESFYLKQLKNQFKKQFGVQAFKELQEEISLIGEIESNHFLDLQNKNKKTNKAAQSTLEILLSLINKGNKYNSESLLYFLDEELIGKIETLNNKFSKYFRKFTMNSFEKEEKLMRKALKKFSINHLNTIVSISETINELSIDTETKKIHNQLNVISENLDKIKNNSQKSIDD
tara:strand:- start:4414 stop:5208 length:795 start_codon:yes stop_codon:yes gene_type:complete